jgi:hypothetical protein
MNFQAKVPLKKYPQTPKSLESLYFMFISTNELTCGKILNVGVSTNCIPFKYSVEHLFVGNTLLTAARTSGTSFSKRYRHALGPASKV